jgi:uncharacterized protein (TIGR00369 family)
MNNETHFRQLERMYLAAPINKIYPPKIWVSEAGAEIQIDVKPEYFHGAGAVHGSVIFKLLDDAAFFATNSLEQSIFVLTTSFTTYLTRPVSSGIIRSVGKVVSQNKTQFIAEAVAYDSTGKELGRGNGIFVRSKIPLVEALGYASA